MNTYYIIFSVVALFLLIGRLRAYLRTGLKGDLIIVLGIIIFLSGFPIQNSSIGLILGAVGFIVINVGLIILGTVERAKVKEIYVGTSIIDRLTGNLTTQYKDKKYPLRVEKSITIKAGIFSIFLAIALYFYEGKDITGLVIDGILLFGGMAFLIIAFLLGDKKKQ